ncbi:MULTISPECIES: helicase SNF2 [unclassified Variovorax]|jgi:hypothetical protein|uniref:helicase SNF2 n=1 Tax=unclassified Variovorax TaxID=663243 RepID=UPI002575F83C|nr:MULTISPECIES: helicase SNF2 [unclassified Variovorax]MDM0088567.1 helicase SNF2 [Variovorax sp. J22G40]MDM0146640.1 helicase SNF2 [Variovorax sp. J2P1-31]
MKTSKILAVAALSLLTIAGAQAETYQGVQTVNSVRSRADVAAEAQATARAGNIYSDAAFAGVAPALTNSVDRATVSREAVQTARLGNIYGDNASAGVLSVAGSRLDRATVQAEARAAARSNTASM